MLAALTKKFCSIFVVSTLKRFKSSGISEESKMKVFTQKRNPLTGNTEWDLQNEDYDFHQEIARSAFADMLHDTERNKKYNRALKLAIEKMHDAGRKANVLDIGTGTGLLSIFAARCGADTITACEAFKPMAECCLKILEKNGVADKITVIPKRSTELIVGEDGDMKEKANILVTEVFDTELIGEGALPTFIHAHKYLLEEDCIVIPDSAVIYAQVVECALLQKWNKLDDFPDLKLKTPEKMKNCPGSAAVHDLQLSQLPRSSFRELSDQIPVFYYDWSGKTPLDTHRTVKQQFQVTGTGTAHMVFMWWELNMDTEGKICLSCAPWWSHPDANMSAERPQDSVPWRDHWMQAVYYLPQPTQLKKDQEATLISCQDEYSLWFSIDKQNQHVKRPICECGVHMVFSRTQVSYLNDESRRSKLVNQLQALDKDSVVLDLNGGSFLGLFAAKLCKNVFILERQRLNLDILNDYVKENNITNVEFISNPNEDILNQVTNVICDPNFSSALLPWENLKMAYLLYKFKDNLKNVTIVPDAFEIWAMPVEFKDLQKIRIPLNKCEGIDMSIFDDLVESSRIISDAEIEAQPLWEYPCKSRGEPRRLLQIDFMCLKQTYAIDGVYPLRENGESKSQCINGFALWAVWKLGSEEQSTGPVSCPTVGEYVHWDMHTRQAVKIFKKSHNSVDSDKWCYQVTCDLDKGQFNVDVDLVHT